MRYEEPPFIPGDTYGNWGLIIHGLGAPVLCLVAFITFLYVMS